MSKKKAFALRMNEDMLKAVEKWAADEFLLHLLLTIQLFLGF